MIVVGYTADRFGHAALEHSIAEAKLAGSPEVHDVVTLLEGQDPALFAQTLIERISVLPR